MEHSNNPFDLLREPSPSPTLHAPTPSVHAASPPPAFLTARDAAILGAVADEQYVPTPSEHPLPTNPESLNNSTLIPSQTPSGMTRIMATPEGPVSSDNPSPSPEQIATIGAALLAQLQALESQSYHPSAASNPLDHADDPDYLQALGQLFDAPAAVTQMVLAALPAPSPRLSNQLNALYRERAARHIEGSNPTTYSSPSASYIAAFLAANYPTPSPIPSPYTHTPSTPGPVASIEQYEEEADRLLDDWLAHKVHLADNVREDHRRDFSANSVGHRGIWELACWLHRAPVNAVDAFVHRVFPSLRLLQEIQHAFTARLTRLRDHPDWHSPHASRVAAYIARRLDPVDQASLERVRLMNTQELLREAAPTPVLTASLPHALSISEDSAEIISARDFHGPIRTPSRSQRHRPISRRPSVTNLVTAPGAPDDHSDDSSSSDSTTPVASPASQNFRGRRIPRELSTQPSAARDTAANPLAVDTPSVTWEGGTQTQEARATLEELRELASLPRFPHEILAGLPQGPNVEMRDLANLQNPQRIGYGFYLQAADLHPLKEGMQIGSTQEINAAFHAVAASLSLGTDRAGEPHLRVLSSSDWFRGAAVVLSATLRGVLTSNNFHAQGDFSLSPCPDEFQLADGLPIPHTQRSLLLEMCSQLTDELGALGDACINRSDLWTAVRARERASIEEAVRAELAPQVDDWKKGMWAGLRSLAVDDAFAFLIDALQAEGAALSHEATAAEALQAESLLWRQQWAQENEERLRRQHEEWKGAALKELQASATTAAQNEWRHWRETELATAKAEALASVTLDDVIAKCGPDAAKLIEGKRRFAREFVASKYTDWVCEEQNRIWPDIEDLAQKSTREDYLREEKDRIYPDIRAEVKAQLDNYRRALLESGQKKIRADLAEERHLAQIKEAASPAPPPPKAKKNKNRTIPMDTTSDSVIKEDEASDEVTAGGNNSKNLVAYTASAATSSPEVATPRTAKPPTMVAHLTANPEVAGLRKLDSSVHCPANAMEDDPSPPLLATAAQTTTQAASASFPPRDPLLERMAQMLTTLTASVSSLASRIDTIEGRKVEFRQPPLPAVVPTKPSTAPAKAAPSTKVTVPTAATSVPASAQCAGPPTVPQAGPSPLQDLATPPPASDVEFPPLAEAAPPPKPKGTAPHAAPAKPNATPDAAAKDDGYIHVGQRGRPAYSTATSKGVAQHEKTTEKAKAVAAAQGRTPAGTLSRKAPPSSPAKANTTKVVIIRHGGFTDKEREQKLRQRNPGDIVKGVRTALELKTAKPIRLLYGHWSREAARTGNFIYVFAGKLSMSAILPYQEWLCAPFPGAAIVPSEGWFWAQLRGVIATSPEGTFWDEDQLTEELRLHPAFENVPFIVKPHWLTHPNNIRDATATVGFAIEDPTGAAVQAAMAGPVSMFSYQVKFVPCGDSPTLIQCVACRPDTLPTLR
ncbi:hypothetical protein EDB83DRAFT_2634060 [Lactarius deliciosus]|nr:hypothetical protein EDB83DRAFT_2634060 [Lactarius deliciosus]